MIRNSKVRRVALCIEVIVLAVVMLKYPFVWPAFCLVALGYIPVKSAKTKKLKAVR
jgi:hypothetical protein